MSYEGEKVVGVKVRMLARNQLYGNSQVREEIVIKVAVSKINSACVFSAPSAMSAGPSNFKGKLHGAN